MQVLGGKTMPLPILLQDMRHQLALKHLVRSVGGGDDAARHQPRHYCCPRRPPRCLRLEQPQQRVVRQRLDHPLCACRGISGEQEQCRGISGV